MNDEYTRHTYALAGVRPEVLKVISQIQIEKIEKQGFYYISLTMGNIVGSKMEAIMQVFDSLFKFKTIDIRWGKVRIDALDD